MKRRVGALLMALVLVMTGFAAYAEEGQPAELAVEDSVEDASVSEEEPVEGEDAPYDEEPAAPAEETAEVAEPEATSETSANTEAEPEEQTTAPEETQGESTAEPEMTVEAEETEESEEDIETYTALSGNLSLTVEAPKGALPENVLLNMQSVEAGTDEYEEVQSYVQESGEEISNLEIADIYFTLDGEKVDPSEAVTVKLGLATFTDADRSSLQAWDYTDRMQGTLNAETQEVEFVTANLQTFAATWNDAQDSNETDALIGDAEVGTEDSLASLSVEVSHRSEDADDEFYPAGTEIIFEVVVTNNGEVPLSDIEVTNNLTAASEPIPLLEANGDSETIEVPYTITTYDETAGSVEMDVAATVQYFANNEPDEPEVLSADGIDFLSIKKPEMEVTIEVTSKPEKGKAYDVDEPITYTVTVENTGKVTISDIEVTCSPVDEDDPSGGKWAIDSLEPDSSKESDEFTYTVANGDNLRVSYNEEYAHVTLKANATYAMGENTAEVEADAKDVLVDVKPRSSQKFVNVNPDEDTVFGDDGEEAKFNNNIVYLISYKNNSKKEKTITITDNLADGLVEYVDSNPKGEYISETGDVKWTLEVPPKTDGYVVLTVKVVGNKGEYIYNSAKVDGKPTNTVSNLIVDDDPTEPTKTVKASNSTKSSSGKELTYTIEYYNHHTDSRTVTITDELDSSLTYVDGSATEGGTCVKNKKGETITWEVKAEPGTEGKVSFKAGFDGGKDGKVENTATVTIEGDDPVATDPVSYSLDSGDSGNDSRMELEKLVDAGEDGDFDDNEEQVNIGDTLTYKIICTNTDTESKTVTITDEVDQGLTYIDGSASDDGEYASGTITWEVTVEPSSEEELTFEATVNNENLKTETIEEQDDITSYFRTDNGDDEDDDGDGDGEGGGYIEEDDIYTSYITVTYKYMYNSAIAKIGDDEKESNTVWNFVYSESTSSGSGSGSGSDGEGSGVKSSVNTSDDTPVAPMAALFGTALAVLGADIIYRRRRTQR